jgi:2-isopropylmalate synthase
LETNDHVEATSSKYRAFAPIGLKDRTWPDAVLTKRPIWCRVDLRDGNQALIEPMDIARKLRMFQTRWWPSASRKSKSAFPPLRRLNSTSCASSSTEDLIPDDVTIQVLTQAREP